MQNSGRERGFAGAGQALRWGTKILTLFVVLMMVSMPAARGQADDPKVAAELKKAEVRAAKEAAAKAKKEAAEAEKIAKAKAEAEKKIAREQQASKEREARQAAKSQEQLEKQKRTQDEAAAKVLTDEARWAPVVGRWTKTDPPEEPVILKGEQKLGTPAAKEGSEPAQANKITFDLAMVSGDKDAVEKLKVWKDWSEYITFNPVSIEEINAFQATLTKALHDQGFVFAAVNFPQRVWNNGIFLAKVDCGALGDITVRNARNYSPEQIIRVLQSQESKFNYAKIHGDIYDLNAKPDLKIDTELKPMIQNGRRVINADLMVDDSFPVHGAIELTNNAAKEAENDFRIRTTLQHLNLTKHDDALTVDWITGGDVADSMNAFAANYFLPIDELWSLNTYGGYNESDYEDVVPQIDTYGKGHFFGASLTRVLHDTPKERVQLTFGWKYQKTESRLDLADEALEPNNVAISMPSLTLGYSSKVFDRFKGKNFAALTIEGSRAGKYGSSEEEVFNGARANVDGTFNITKLHLMRLQRLFDGEEAPGKWFLLVRTDAQYSSDPLPSAAREYLGGFSSVRGYEEYEISGDNAVTAKIELITPLLENFIPGLRQDPQVLADNPKYWGMHRLNFVAFTDLGYVENQDPVAGDIDNQALASIGAGMRLGLTKYAQMSLDYGFPLIDATDDTPDAGRLHLSLQVQF